MHDPSNNSCPINADSRNECCACAKPLSQKVYVKAENQMEYYMLANAKAHLRLQKVGMKSRAGAIRPKLANYLGLSPRDSYDKYLEAVEKKMADMRHPDLEESDGLLS